MAQSKTQQKSNISAKGRGRAQRRQAEDALSEDDDLADDDQLGELGAAGRGQRNASRRAVQRKVVTKIYKVIDSTPQDERGLVPETTFSVAGVERLMKLLNERVSDTSKPGGKLAGNVLKFLETSDAEDQSIHNASLKKLQQISKRIETRRNKRKSSDA